MNKSESNSLKLSEPASEIVRLHQKMAKQKNPSGGDVDRLRGLVVSTPAAWPLATHTVRTIREAIIQRMSKGATESLMLAELDILAKQLDYDAAPPLERLLIEHILTVRLRLIHTEHEYTHRVMNQSIAVKAGEYWDNLLSSSHARFLRAIETLARVRRLARNTPALQINIAQSGGKQVNVQDGVNARDAKLSANRE